MVVVEIRTPVYDEESCAIEWVVRATVRAQGRDLEINPEGEIIDRELQVVDVLSRRKPQGNDDPEVWARNLPHAFRAGDYVAVIVEDANEPQFQQDDSAPEPEPVVPEVPAANGTPAALRAAARDYRRCNDDASHDEQRRREPSCWRGNT